MAGVFRQPRTLEDGLRMALARRQGTREELMQRITDMRASGLLIEV